MFRGRSYHTIDEKGRISIPTRFRDFLKSTGEDQIMVTNLDGYLLAFPMPLWEQIEGKLNAQASILKKETQKFVRFFVGGAEPCSIDKQGRILVPPALRKYARLEKEVTLVGLGNRFEIWNKDGHDQEMAEVESGNYDEGARAELAECLLSN